MRLHDELAFAGVRQELLAQFTGPCRGCDNGVQVLFRAFGVHRREIGVAENAGQQVVEIVGDAAGQ